MTVTAKVGLYPGNLGPFLQYEERIDRPVGATLEARANILLSHLKPQWRHLLGSFSFTEGMIADFHRWAEWGIIYGGSDGLEVGGHGAHGFAWTSGERQTAIWGGAATTPGNREEMSSQRAEHAGSIALMLVMHILHQVVNKAFSVTLWVDNDEVVRRGLARDASLQWKDTLVLDYDLWMVSNEVQDLLDYPLRWEHIDSHIEEKLRADPTRTLKGDKLAWRLNEAADELAGNQRIKGEVIDEVLFEEARVMVSYRGTFLYGPTYDRVVEGEHGRALKEYLCAKFKWTSATFDTIDWRAMRAVSQSLNGTRETNFIKLAINWQNDNHQNELLYDKDGRCPACGLAMEDHLHFLACSDPVLYRLNTQAVNKVVRTMVRLKTAGVLTGIFKRVIGAMRAGMSPAPFLPKDDKLGRLIGQAWKEQQTIGWDNMVKGRLSSKWALVQEAYYRSNPDTKTKKTFSGIGWATGMIKALMSMLLEMWANRCGCLHGHTRQQKREIAGEMVGNMVRQCFRQRGTIAMEHQDIFAQSPDEMLKRRHPQYLRAWVDMFYALQLQQRRLSQGRTVQLRVETEEEDSMATFDTTDLAEYLLDETDGMDREYDLANGGEVLTPPSQCAVPRNICLELGGEGSAMGALIDAGRITQGEAEMKFGNVELWKRKPPDGTPQ